MAPQKISVWDVVDDLLVSSAEENARVRFPSLKLKSEAESPGENVDKMFNEVKRVQTKLFSSFGDDAMGVRIGKTVSKNFNRRFMDYVRRVPRSCYVWMVPLGVFAAGPKSLHEWGIHGGERLALLYESLLIDRVVQDESVRKWFEKPQKRQDVGGGGRVSDDPDQKTVVYALFYLRRSVSKPKTELKAE